eukprot:TRINITY_DN1939_c0_g1_i4.p1 TRINITY_DN1939_c0_g1~~TRINITY_DN1939_c0_g1_i4.p1  ORF type:complete len:341 (+),score=53.97 TRINITY_DN1939_c0_g1_i4:28-1023(+)
MLSQRTRIAQLLCVRKHRAFTSAKEPTRIYKLLAETDLPTAKRKELEIELALFELKEIARHREEIARHREEEARRREEEYRRNHNPTDSEIIEDVLAFLKENGHKNGEQRGFPQFNDQFQGRSEIRATIEHYFDLVFSPKIWTEKDKCPILAGYGVPGCGKTRVLFELLKSSTHGQQDGWAVSKLGKNTRTLFISFNGEFPHDLGGNIVALSLLFYITKKNFVELPWRMKITTTIAAAILSRHLRVDPGTKIVVGVDELHRLGDSAAAEALSAFARVQQASLNEHPILFVFSSLVNSVFMITRSNSGRPIQEFEFAPLSDEQNKGCLSVTP